MPRTAFPAALAALLALAAALLLVRLGEPDWTPRRPGPALAKRYVWDECYSAFTAHRYLEGDPGVWRAGATAKDLAAFCTYAAIAVGLFAVAYPLLAAVPHAR